MLHLPQRAVMQTHQRRLIHLGIRRRRDQTPLLPQSKCQGETEAAPLSHDPSGTVLPPFSHVATSAHVIDRALSLSLVVPRAPRRKPRTTAMLSLTLIPRKKP